jgi:hypothetical protein
MESVCIETKPINKHTREGLRILARIIARDFMAKQVLNGDAKNDGADSEHLQYKRPLPFGIS